MEEPVGDAEMKIIIVGCGKVGLTLIKQLSAEKHDITVIDLRSEAIMEATNSYDCMGLVGNGASYSVQKEANIDDTDLLIAVTGNDELNLLCCLIAKKAGNTATIARVRNPVYSQEISYIKEELGLSMVINPEFASAQEIARILRFPSADKIDTFAHGRVEILNFVITEMSPLKGMTLIDVSKKYKCEVLICAVERGDDAFIPNGPFILRENDRVSFVAAPRYAREFFEKIGVDTHQVKNTMIVGGGMIAYYLAMLLRGQGINVKIIDSDRKRCEELSELLPRATIINGDATNKDVLMEEGIASCDSFVALTGIDEANIFLSMYAKNVSKAKKIITKINRISFDDMISSFQAGSVIAQKNITSDYILQQVRLMQNTIGSNVETLYKLVDGKVEALEFSVREQSEVVGIPLMELKLKRNVLIACINRGGVIITPNGQSTIQLGDTVIVVTTQKGLGDIKDILE